SSAVEEGDTAGGDSEGPPPRRRVTDNPTTSTTTAVAATTRTVRRGLLSKLFTIAFHRSYSRQPTTVTEPVGEIPVHWSARRCFGRLPVRFGHGRGGVRNLLRLF